MPLSPIPDLMQHAREHRYAVGYFESWNLESLQGVLDAAEQTRSPIIVGFNGEFLSGKRVLAERLELYAALGKAAAQTTTVPCGFIFNECSSDSWVRQAIEAGFNLVMPIAMEGETSQDYALRTRSVVQYAHAHQVAVEAELGSLPFEAAPGQSTDPQQAAWFVKQTAVDLLAVSVGNIHVSLKGQHDLDLQRLAAIHQATKVPLVLHGGSGISPTSLKEAIKLGVGKVNYGTYLKQRYLNALRKGLESDLVNPHQLLGMGGPHDLLIQGRKAVQEAVLERIETLGCVGKGR